MTQLKAPFPWFGGKSRAAHLVWQRFGDVSNYVEPFAGSLAVLLGRPGGAGRTETANDLDGLLVNFWRATQSDPTGVAEHADWPVTELDLTARHLWLVNAKQGLARRLESDPHYFDAKLAGWWLWGVCAWIGGGWCSGKGPWTLGDDGLLTLGDAGRGINRQLPHLGNAGRGINRQGSRISEMLAPTSERLRGVRITCGDWERVLGPTPTVKLGITGVFLDPPYAASDADSEVYGEAYDATISARVREWAIANGSNPLLRIALCGYAGEHADLPEGWAMVNWKANGGYGGGVNRYREVIWFSPHCNNRQTLFDE